MKGVERMLHADSNLFTLVHDSNFHICHCCIVHVHYAKRCTYCRGIELLTIDY